MINHLSELLGRFKNIGLGEKISKEVLAEEIKSAVGQNLIAIKDIAIKNGTAVIRGGSALKSEIFIHKEEILKKSREKAGINFVIRDIR